MSDEQRFVKHYGDVGVCFDPAPHTYDAILADGEVFAVPAVSDICECVPKFFATWHEMNGIRGMMALNEHPTIAPSPDDAGFNYGLIEKLGQTSKAIMNAAAERGTNVHAAYRGWVLNGVHPTSKDYDGATAGYIDSLSMLTNALEGSIETVLCEEPLVSARYGFAGTPDHLLRLTKEVTLQVGGCVGEGKRPKYAKFPAALKVVADLKTSKQVFLSHEVQTSAYETMAVETGVLVPDERWVIIIKDRGEGYNVRRIQDRSQLFLAALAMYNAHKRPEGWRGRQTAVVQVEPPAERLAA